MAGRTCQLGAAPAGGSHPPQRSSTINRRPARSFRSHRASSWAAPALGKREMKSFENCGMCGCETAVGADCPNCGNKRIGATDRSQRMGVCVQRSRSSRLSEQDRLLFLQAWGQYGRTGKSDESCDECGCKIVFEQVGSATKHFCSCGKFTGALRGL